MDCGWWTCRRCSPGRPLRADGTGEVKVFFQQWLKGKQELVWPKEFATAPFGYPAPPFDKR